MASGNNVSSNIKFINQASYVINIEDDIINVDSTGTPITLYLPNITQSGFLLNPKFFYINDIGNNASTNNITILGIGNDVNGGASFVVNTNMATCQAAISGQEEWLITSSQGSGGGGGSVTSFGAGNLAGLFETNVVDPTSTPALTFNFYTQSAAKVLAGPVNGADATPSFRLLQTTDIPDLSSLYLSTSKWNYSGNDLIPVVAGYNIGDSSNYVGTTTSDAIISNGISSLDETFTIYQNILSGSIGAFIQNDASAVVELGFYSSTSDKSGCVRYNAGSSGFSFRVNATGKTSSGMTTIATISLGSGSTPTFQMPATTGEIKSDIYKSIGTGTSPTFVAETFFTGTKRPAFVEAQNNPCWAMYSTAAAKTGYIEYNDDGNLYIQLNSAGKSTNGATQVMKIYENGRINMPLLPTSSAGLVSGDLWNNAGIVTIV